MSNHEIGIILLAAIIAVVLVVAVNMLGFHPYRWVLHRKQRKLLQGVYRPPSRSYFWDGFYLAAMAAVIVSAFWMVLEPRGWAIVALIFATIMMVGLAFLRDLYMRWYEQTPKWKAGTWRSLPVKELGQVRLVDRIKLRREVESTPETKALLERADGPSPVGGGQILICPEGNHLILEEEMTVEAAQTGGISPEGGGITTPNRKAIVIARSRLALSDQAIADIDHLRLLNRDIPFVSGWPLGDIYFTPGDPIPFLMGFDRDEENPTPECVREFVKSHSQHLRWKPSTLVLLIPDLYPAFAGTDMTPAPRPSGMERILYDQSHRIADLESKLISRGKSDQKVRTARRGGGLEYPVESET